MKMNGEPQITKDLFDRHLIIRPNHHNFAENAGVLMQQMEALSRRTHARARTYGFVIPPYFDREAQDNLLSLLTPRDWTASIDRRPVLHLDDGSFRYTLITIRP